MTQFMQQYRFEVDLTRGRIDAVRNRGVKENIGVLNSLGQRSVFRDQRHGKNGCPEIDDSSARSQWSWGGRRGRASKHCPTSGYRQPTVDRTGIVRREARHAEAPCVVRNFVPLVNGTNDLGRPRAIRGHEVPLESLVDQYIEARDRLRPKLVRIANHREVSRLASFYRWLIEGLHLNQRWG